MREPTQEYLHECFDYVDGKLYWKERPRHHFNSDRGWKSTNTRKSGKPAGDLTDKDNPNKDSYYRVCIDQKRYRTCRIIYIMHYGSIDNDLMIDHRDGNTTNDKIDNLRLVTNKVNQYNRKKSKANSSGVNGVSKCYKDRWRARGQSDDGKEIVLYYGSDFDEAVKARKDWEAKHPNITRRHGK